RDLEGTDGRDGGGECDGAAQAVGRAAVPHARAVAQEGRGGGAQASRADAGRAGRRGRLNRWRLLFLAALVGGLVYWARLRGPREMVVEIDLTGALPGEITEVDIVVSRDGHALSRTDLHYGK